MWITAILFGAVVFLFTKWYRERCHNANVLKECGIDGPHAGPVFGNYPDIRAKGFHPCLREWCDKYGKTFGYYEGHRGIIVTSDAELVKQTVIKEFSNFHGRKRWRPDNKADDFEDMFNARGEKWRKLRSISSPLFATRRMKEMSPLISHITDRAVEVLEEKCEEGAAFDIYKVFQGMTLEVIASCAFGIEVDALRAQEGTFLEKCRRTFEIVDKPPVGLKILMGISVIFPSIFRYLRKLLHIVVFEHPLKWFYGVAERIIRERKQLTDKCRVDFIQLMLEAEESGVPLRLSDLTATTDDEEGHTRLDEEQVNDDVTDVKSNMTENRVDGVNQIRTSTTEKRRLTLEEMQGQCALFLLAGYETTSTAMAFLAYELAMNPDVQDKLAQEIDESFPEHEEEVTYERLMKMTYLDMVIKESLRRHTIAVNAFTRQASKDCTVNGVHFPAGAHLQINSVDIHMNPDYWGPEDPKLFVPERFLPERVRSRHPMAWVPFGGGPRNCIGMRFAQMELKMATVNILRKFIIQRCEATPEMLPITTNSVRAPANGVHVRLVKRHH